MTAPTNVQPIRQPEGGGAANQANDSTVPESMLAEALKRRAAAEEEAQRTDPTKNGLANAVLDGFKAYLVKHGMPPEDLEAITLRQQTEFKRHEFAGSVDGRPFRLAFEAKNPHKPSQKAIDFDNHVIALTKALKKIALASKKQSFGAETMSSGVNHTTLCVSGTDANSFVASVNEIIQQAGFKGIDASQYPFAATQRGGR